MDHFPHYVTPPQKFGYHCVNLTKGGKSFNLMYCVYGEIRTVYYSSSCNFALLPTTCERLTLLIVRRVCFLLLFVALPYDFPWPSYASTKLTRSFQSELPPLPGTFSIATKVLPRLFEPGECRLRWNMAWCTVVSVVHGLWKRIVLRVRGRGIVHLYYGWGGEELWAR